MKNWKDETTKWIDRTSKNLIVVSVLIATIAFSAAFNVPGSYNDDGVATLRKTVHYHIFLILDTIAMSASVAATVLLLVAKVVNKRGSWHSFSTALFFLWISLFAMVLAFAVAITVVLGTGKSATRFFVPFISTSCFSSAVIIVYIYVSPAKLGTMRKFISYTKKKSQKSLQTAVQQLEVVTFVKGAHAFIILSICLSIIACIVLSSV
jgi:Domain of unknown function